MDDGLNLMLSQELCEGASARDVPSHVADRCALLSAENIDSCVSLELTIDDENLASLAKEPADNVRADETETASDEHRARHRQAIVNSGS